MSLFDYLFRLISGSDPRAPREPGDDHPNPAAVALDEAEAEPADDAPLPTEDLESGAAPDEGGPDGPPTWWRPPAPRVTRLLRPSGKSRTIDGALYDNLVAVLRDPELELPRMSHVAQRALGLLNDNEADFGRVARIIEQDPAIATEILRVANSPLYRGVTEVNRLDTAVARLGQKRLQSLVLTLSMRGLAIRSGSASLGEQLWQRSIASGVVVAAFAPRFRLPEDEAFLAGLLHDVGMLACLRVAHDYQRTHGRKVPRGVFEDVAYEWHGHVGMRLADSWNLPSPLPELIGGHHAEPDPDDANFRYHCLVQLADACCDLLGFGRQVNYDLFELPCSRHLGLVPDPATLELLESLPERITARQQVF